MGNSDSPRNITKYWDQYSLARVAAEILAGVDCHSYHRDDNLPSILESIVKKDSAFADDIQTKIEEHTELDSEKSGKIVVILNRATSHNPMRRYNSCKEFILEIVRVIYSAEKAV